MTSKVLGSGSNSGSQEIVLNDVRYMTVGPVEPIPANTYPAKVVTGDTTRDSDPNLSSMIFSDFREGQGLDIMSGFEVNRCWTSTCNIRYKGSLVLSPLVTTTAVVIGSSNSILTLSELASEVYAFASSIVRKYDDSGDSWGATLDTQTANLAYNMVLGGTEYLLFTHPSSAGYTYTTDGSSFTDDTQDTDVLVEWDDRLWGLDSNTGALWYAFTPGTETTVNAILPLRSSSDLQAFYTFGGFIYALTNQGLYRYDAANDIFTLTSLFGTKNSWGFAGSTNRVTIWRDRAYLGLGQEVYEHSREGGVDTIRVVGPDLDDGLDGNTAEISSVVSSLNEVFVGMGDKVYSWNGSGWYQVHAMDNSLSQDLLVSNAYSGKYRLYGEDRNGSGHPEVWYIDLPQIILNPKKDTTVDYTASGELKTPWFHADQVDVDKLAVRLKIETEDTNSNETVTISYATDYDDDIYSQFDAITTNGIKTLTFPLFGNYLDYDGANDLTTVSDDSAIQDVFDSGGTVEALINADSDGENDLGMIANKASWALGLSSESSGTAKIRFAQGFSGTQGTWTTTNAVITIDGDHHIALAYDADAVGNDPTIYIDGVSVAITEDSTPVGTRTTDVGSDLIIGNNAATTSTFDGAIDDVRMWSDTRTAAEISANKDAELTGNESGLVGYWKFNENTGTTANDSSTNSNSGTVSGATWTEHSDPKGRSFRAIRFKIALARGGTTTLSPRLVSLTLEYRKKLTYKRGYRMILDLDSEHKGRQPGDLRSAFQKVEALETLAEFTFRENDRMYVDVYREAGEQQSGYDQTGRIAIRVLEA